MPYKDRPFGGKTPRMLHNGSQLTCEIAKDEYVSDASLMTSEKTPPPIIPSKPTKGVCRMCGGSPCDIHRYYHFCLEHCKHRDMLRKDSPRWKEFFCMDFEDTVTLLKIHIK